MGPLATAAQLKDVRAGIARLEAEGKPDSAGQPGRLSRRAFSSRRRCSKFERTARQCTSTKSSARSRRCCRTTDNPAAIVARGNGGLVCSVYSEDAAFIEETVAGIAPWHGRIYLGHPKIELSPGPGTVLPQLVHGGPGRAGGGEELGGGARCRSTCSASRSKARGR